MRTTSVILAAGRGSRLDDGGGAADYSKPLIELMGRTLLQRAVAACRSAGARRIVVVTGFRADRVEADLGRYDQGDIETVFNADWQRSNGLSVLAARPLVSDAFTLLMTDHIFDSSILGDLAGLAFAPETAAALAVDYDVQRTFDLADATKVQVESGLIAQIGKSLPRYNGIDCGLFACTPAVFEALDEATQHGDCSLSDGMTLLAQRDALLALDIEGREWQDVDTPEMLEQALQLCTRLDA